MPLRDRRKGWRPCFSRSAPEHPVLRVLSRDALAFCLQAALDSPLKFVRELEK